MLIFLNLQLISKPILCSGKNRPLLMAHYMPWFQAPPVSNSYGWHWTMKNFDPNKFDQNGNRQIASHFYPLTGPYDSSDKDVLEYQVLLMKLCGIDGVLVDWYGDENFYDYGIINNNTDAIFKYIQKAKLNFAIVYEDQTIKHMIAGGHISNSDDLIYGKKAISYLQNKWFTSNNYLKFDSHPVLLNFGPQYFKNSMDWETIFSGLTVSPLFFTEDNRLAPVAAGAYPWPPMWKSNSSGVLTQDALNEYLNQFYQKAAGWNYKIGSAFPGFYDIYLEGGAGSSYGFLDSQNGETFNSTLLKAFNGNLDIIQLVTWNDYGEGTVIEPTVEFGYKYLSSLQLMKKTFIDSTFQFGQEDLQVPFRLYQLRKNNVNKNNVNQILDRVFDLIVASQIEDAKKLIDSLSTPTNIYSRDVDGKFKYYLEQNYPNPFNPTTVISWRLAVGSIVTLKIYDLLGREVATLINEEKPAGNYKVKFNMETLGSKSLPSGVYFYTLKTNNFVQTKKMILMK